jgi:hypothetical protein
VSVLLPAPAGSQPPIELLRQLADQGGWYGRDCVFRTMVDVQMVAAMGPPGGGRTFVTNRYTRHYNTLALPQVRSRRAPCPAPSRQPWAAARPGFSRALPCTLRADPCLHCLPGQLALRKQAGKQASEHHQSLAQVSDDMLQQIFGTILAWHLDANHFPAAIKAIGPAVISATLDVYSRSVASLLPTPAKSHYTFNLRDCARVVQGVMMMPAAALSGTEGLAGGVEGRFQRLWVHEVLRVFYDRLVDQADQQWLLEQVRLLGGGL